jgi:signal peptidase II
VTTGTAPQRRAVPLVLIAVAVYAADVITKVVALSALEGKEPVRALGGLVYLQILRNPGAGFSLATDFTWVFASISIGVVIAIVWFTPKVRSLGWAVGLGLMLGSALGNLTDRLFRAPGPMLGHVIDFVSPFAPNADVFPVFNVADAALVTGGALVVLMSLLGREYDGRVTVRKNAEAAS